MTAVMHMHDSVICICSKSAFREKKLRQTLTDPDKILQSYVGRTQISRVKILTPCAKEAQSGGERWVFCEGYIEFAFLCNGTDRHEIPAKTSIGMLYRTLIEELFP